MENNPNQIVPGPHSGGDKKTASIKEIAAKFETKHELYHWLTTELDMYLPSYRQTSIYWMREIILGKRKCKFLFCSCLTSVFCLGLKAKRVNHYNVPFYETLTIKQIHERWCQAPTVEVYLPPKEDLDEVPRQWLINVCYTRVGDDFAKWVKKLQQERNAAQRKKGKGEIEMDAEIYAAFQASTLTSSKS